MKVIAHRGLFLHKKDNNTIHAFRAAMRSDFGIETDLRDRKGQVVIAHDPPRGGEPTLNRFFKIISCEKYKSHITVAFNIKSDGLASSLKKISKDMLKNIYFFDMSVPDMKSYAEFSLPFYTRMSEEEKQCAFYDKAQGVWLDSLHSDWYNKKLVESILNDGKELCIVSPELHKRDPLMLWKKIKGVQSNKLYICTDYPDKARQYFC